MGSPPLHFSICNDSPTHAESLCFLGSGYAPVKHPSLTRRYLGGCSNRLSLLLFLEGWSGGAWLERVGGVGEGVHGWKANTPHAEQVFLSLQQLPASTAQAKEFRWGSPHKTPSQHQDAADLDENRPRSDFGARLGSMGKAVGLGSDRARAAYL